MRANGSVRQRWAVKRGLAATTLATSCKLAAEHTISAHRSATQQQTNNKQTSEVGGVVKRTSEAEVRQGGVFSQCRSQVRPQEFLLVRPPALQHETLQGRSRSEERDKFIGEFGEIHAWKGGEREWMNG